MLEASFTSWKTQTLVVDKNTPKVGGDRLRMRTELMLVSHVMADGWMLLTGQAQYDSTWFWPRRTVCRCRVRSHIFASSS